jgi:hypothetical protein
VKQKHFFNKSLFRFGTGNLDAFYANPGETEKEKNPILPAAAVSVTKLPHGTPEARRGSIMEVAVRRESRISANNSSSSSSSHRQMAKCNYNSAIS